MMINVKNELGRQEFIRTDRIVRVRGKVGWADFGGEAFERVEFDEYGLAAIHSAGRGKPAMIRVEMLDYQTVEVPVSAIVEAECLDHGYLLRWQGADGKAREGLISFEQADETFDFTSTGQQGFRAAVRNGGGSAEDIAAALDCAFNSDGASNAA